MSLSFAHLCWGAVEEVGTISKGGPTRDEELCGFRVPIKQGVMQRRVPIVIATRDVNQWVIDEDLGRLDPV
jgi:hypothetical protein